MKIMRARFAILMCLALVCLLCCQKESGLSDVQFTVGDESVSPYGETVAVAFVAGGNWSANLVFVGEEDAWARIDAQKSQGQSGAGKIRVDFDENPTEQERVVELWLEISGFAAERLCVFTQEANRELTSSSVSRTLVDYMDEILREDYLWADAYKTAQIDKDVDYTTFLYTNLLKLGDVNNEDGGYYRAHMAASGERYLYTSIQEVAPQVKGYNVASLGFGPFGSTLTSPESETVFIFPGYVRPGSPAESAGLKRGDFIHSVNGVSLTTSNCSSYMQTLQTAASGTFSLGICRYVDGAVADGGVVSVSAGAYAYTPVLYKSCLSEGSSKIGYLVYESFDLSCQQELRSAVQYFVDEGITDLVLDLRFNSGGAVAQSRWLSGCIAGSSNYDETFARLTYADGRYEDWCFRSGYDSATDNLGVPVDLGLTSLYVICSYCTASAAELVINSLAGIDFPVYLYGGRTEGKNVGMVVHTKTVSGRKFEFSPVSFYLENAKGFRDYSNGFEPHKYVNNDNGSSSDDADNAFPYSFGDWDDMDFNVALQWAWCDITGNEPWRTSPVTSRSLLGSFAAEISSCRCGSRVYLD